MSLGQGNILVQQKNEINSGPPFAIGSAVNGLSVDGLGRVVLGQDIGAVGNPAILLNDREIPTNFFNVNFISPTGSLIRLDTNTPQILVNDPAGTGGNGHFLGYQLFFQGTANGAAIALDLLPDPNLSLTGAPGLSEPKIQFSLQAANEYLIDWDRVLDQFTIGSTLAAVRIRFDDNLQTFTEEAAGNPYLFLDALNSVYQIGDITGVVGSTFLFVLPAVGIQQIGANINGNQFFFLDNFNARYQIGDINLTNNGVGLDINDGVVPAVQIGDIFGAFDNYVQVIPGQKFQLNSLDPGGVSQAAIIGLSTAGTELLSLFTTNAAAQQTFNSIDGANGIWRATMQGGGAFGTYLRMSDFNQRVDAGSDTGVTKHYFLLDILNNLFQMGDIDNVATGNFIEIATGNLGSQYFRYKNQVAPTGFLDIDNGNAIYQMGDLDTTVNGNFIAVDDAASRFRITNAAVNAVVNINGVDGFTGTVTPVTTITVNGGIVTNVA